MKKFYSFLVLFGIIFIGSVLRVNDVSAYYKDNCYAAQWEHVVNVKGDFDQHNIYSTKKLCYSNNKIEVGKLPDKTYSVSLPKYKDVEKDSVTVKYCTKMVAGVCITTNKQTFKLSDYNNDFGKMVKAMDDVLSGAAAPDGYTKIAFDKNDAQYSMEVQQSSDDDGAIGEIKKDCSNQGGARSLGWIICPIMSLLGEATEDIYNGAVEPALKVEPKLFSEANSNVEDAWSTFRNVANIVFVIIMLLVIFSQLTGVGIDNYGIKKILPKLVVVAVLTNLSYVLCVLAIDISNILGNSFQGLFEGLKEGLNLNLDFGDGTVIGDQIKSTAGSMVGVGILAALVGMSGAIWEAPMIALSLLIGAIGVVVSVFFLFILLAAREATIVVLVVLSPAAMVLYALPNTKKIFDKWLKAFEGLLLVYPIAGLLVGGGNYVSALLIHSGMGSDFFGALTAMIAGVLPIFFIPTALKGSFSALGTIGAKISGFGASASGKVTGAMRGSNAYKNAQDSARRWANRNQAGVDKNGRVIKGANRFIRGGKWGMGAARMSYLRDLKETGVVDNITDDNNFESAIANVKDEERKQKNQEHTQRLYKDSVNDDLDGLIKKWNVARGANGNGEVNVDDLNGYTNIIQQRYGAAGANKIAQEIAKMDMINNGNDRTAMSTLQQTMSDNSAFANDMRNKAADAYQMINNGGRAGGSWQDLSYFAENNEICTTAKDWSTQSASTLKRAIESGKLDNNMINALLNSTASDIQSGIQTDQEKVKVLKEGLLRNGANTNNNGTTSGGTNADSINIPHDKNNTQVNVGDGGGADYIPE